MRVKIIEDYNKSNLERDINEFLKARDGIEIFDIKYSGNGCYTPQGASNYSAMIIFKE